MDDKVKEISNGELKEIKSAGFGMRHIQSVLLFFAVLSAYTMRVNMSLIIVAMTDPTLPNTFDWSNKTQSVILSSFFWGYIVLQIPGGVLASRVGGRWLLLIVVGVNSAVTLILPLSSHYIGWQGVCACRVIQGLAQGLLYPSIHHLIGKWIPLEEKNRLGTFIYAGGQLGTAIQLIASGFIADSLGWEAILYIDGGLGAIWVLFYVFIGADCPQSSKLISEKEREYIQTSLGQVGEQKKLPTPWRKIFASLPFFALTVMHCGHNWGFWTLMTEIPSYMKKVLDVDIKANGVMSALPYLAMYLLSFPFGYMSDLALRKKWVSVTACRKISSTIGEWGPGFALIGLSYAPAGNVTFAVVMLTIVVGLNAGQFTGYLLVHIDMSPNFAGMMMGVTNFFANIVSIVAPLVAGVILVDETSAEDWRKVFYLSSAIYFLSNLFFIIFATSEKQPWNEPEDNSTETPAEQKTEKIV